MFISSFLDFQKTRYARFMNHRVPPNKRYQPTEYEHAANCATHAFWIIPSILGSSVLYVLSDNQWEAISAWIYGFGLSGLFIVSTIFHTISWKKRHLRNDKNVKNYVKNNTPEIESDVAQLLALRDVAESALECLSSALSCLFFLLRLPGHLAGCCFSPRLNGLCCSPRLNLRELGPWASHMRWLVWIMASVGTVYVFFFHERYKLVELVCYVIMGFFPAVVILSMPNTDGLSELMAGGLFYCLGTVFFKSDGRIPFAHAIWHLFVALGAGTHYYAIWRYLYRPDAIESKTSRLAFLPGKREESTNELLHSTLVPFV
nr:PREDICTED: monocyte to macrophage differentiation factor 2 [Anolis carolinensis]|eukprot:XP_016853300.1 PREDICTED: monocyte to macrophage differentiation factor 2 [Anolis carolinensis]